MTAARRVLDAGYRPRGSAVKRSLVAESRRVYDPAPLVEPVDAGETLERDGYGRRIPPAQAAGGSKTRLSVAGV